MIRINLLDTELDLKIVITGPEGSGKTSFITYLYLNARRRFRSSLTSYNNLVGKTLFFDHLRLLYGKAGRKTIVLNIFTTPGADAIDRRRDEVLEFADAVIFVFDPRETGGREARRFISEVSRIAAAQKLPSSPDIPTIRYLNHKTPSQRSKKPHLAKLFLKKRSPDFSGSILTGERVWETLDAAARGALLNRGAKKSISFPFAPRFRYRLTNSTRFIAPITSRGEPSNMTGTCRWEKRLSR